LEPIVICIFTVTTTNNLTLHAEVARQQTQ